MAQNLFDSRPGSLPTVSLEESDATEKNPKKSAHAFHVHNINW